MVRRTRAELPPEFARIHAEIHEETYLTRVTMDGKIVPTSKVEVRQDMHERRSALVLTIPLDVVTVRVSPEDG